MPSEYLHKMAASVQRRSQLKADFVIFYYLESKESNPKRIRPTKVKKSACNFHLRQEFLQIFIHALLTQLVQSVVAMDDLVSRYHHHPDPMHVLAQLAADSWAHHHVQSCMAPTRIAMVVTREHGFDTWNRTRCINILLSFTRGIRKGQVQLH